MKHIDEIRLETDRDYRFEYLSEFVGFEQQDIDTIHRAAQHLEPLVPSLVDAIYDKLFGYDATKRHFVPRQSGFEGSVPPNIDSLSMDHEVIAFRKQHLGRYVTRLVTRPYDGSMIGYLDAVGKMHTHKAGSERLQVPLVQMNALMGFLSDALMTTILALGLDADATARTLQAFNKLLWLQNDLITRHYEAERAPA